MKKRCAELDILLKKLYETYALGKMPESRYDALSASYEKEQRDLKDRIAESQKELATFVADGERIERFLALAQKYTDLTELTTPMINEFVEKILVHAPDKSSGRREQEVEIHLKFIGNFMIPVQQDMPEETAEERELEEKRAGYRRKYQRRKELAAQRAESA